MRVHNLLASVVLVSAVSLASPEFPKSGMPDVVPLPGTITVYTIPFAAGFWLTGPASYSGETTYSFSFAGPIWSWSRTNCPPGVYTITYTTVPGYISPPSQTAVLGSGGLISFSGGYESTGLRTVSPGALSFTYQMGQALPAAQPLSVVTPGAFSGIAAYPYGNTSWLSVTPARTMTPATFMVTVNPSGLSDGTYEGLITFAFDQGFQPIGVPVTLVVLATPQIQVSPASLSFAYQAGNSPPEGQLVSITSLYKNVSVSVSSNVGWLNAHGAGTTPMVLTAWVEPNGLAAGTYHGEITITAGALNSPYTIPAALTVTGTPPAPANMTVVNAASFDKLVAPCSIVSIFGTNLAQSQAAASTTPLPFTLGGASVTVNGRAVPLFFASPGQLNVQVHCDLPPGLYQVQVNNGAASGWTSLQMSLAAPGLFLWQDRWIAGTNQDGSVHGEYNPAAPGSIVTAYFTGQGLLDHTISMNQPAPINQLLHPLLKPTVTINGQPAEVLFAGLSPGSIGLAQLNIRVPDLPAGQYPVTVTIGGISSNAAVLCIGSGY